MTSDRELHPFATPRQFQREGYNGALVITVPNLGGLTVVFPCLLAGS